MDFSDALRAMKDGQKVARTSWVEDNISIHLFSEKDIKFDRDYLGIVTAATMKPEIYMSKLGMTSLGSSFFKTYDMPIEDVLADDWVVVKKVEDKGEIITAALVP
jgi:hypothetical protein